MAICEDCGKTISRGSRWCMPCGGMHRRKPLPTCKTCGQLVSRGAQRCRTCQARKNCEALRGQDITPEHRRKIGLAHAGKRLSDATKDKLRHAHLARAAQSLRHPSSWRGIGFRAIRKHILQRDHYACVKCGRTGRGLSVHHLRDSEETGGVWDNSDGNLQTLCRFCHLETHATAQRPCVECGELFAGTNLRSCVCSPACRKQRRNRQQRARWPAWPGRSRRRC